MVQLDVSKIVLLELIKKSQFGGAIEFPIENCDWDLVYSEAQNQTVLGIIAPEVPVVVRESDEKWQKIQDQLFAFNLRYFYAENELTKLLDDADIPFVILKGVSAAIYYSHPERRSMGDIDFIVPQDCLEKTQKLLVDNQYVLEKQHTYKRHIGYIKNGISFELHHHYSHDGFDIEDYLIEGIKNRVYEKIDYIEFSMLPKLSNGLLLLDHLRHHLRSGLGLRQVIDWMMYVYRILDDSFWNTEFEYVAQEKGLVTFAKTVTRMCQIYLGLPNTFTWCMDADLAVCDLLLESLFISGNFGRKNGQGRSIEMASVNIKKRGLFRYLQLAGEHNWKAYHKHHYLKPFCWFYQIFHLVWQGIKTGRNRKQLRNDFERSHDRYELLKKLGID